MTPRGDRFLAIDIGSDSVRVASVHMHMNSCYVDRIRQSDFADNFSKDGIAAGIKACIDDIQKSNPVGREYVYMNFLNPYIEIKKSNGIFISKNKKNIINNSDIEKVLLNAQENVDIPYDRFVYKCLPKHWVLDDNFVDKYPINMSANRIECDVDVVTCLSESRDFMLDLADELMLNVECLSPCIFSLERALLSQREKEDGVILIDLGSSFTNVIVYRKSELVCVFTYPHSSRDITEELSVNFNIPFEDAESIKKEHSVVYLPLLDSDYDIETRQIYTNNFLQISRRDVSLTAANKMMEILITIKRKIKDYADDLSLFKSGVVVTGGGAMHKGCCELAEHIFKLPVNIGICDRPDGLDEEFVSPKFSTLLSLIKTAEKDFINRNNNTQDKKPVNVISKFKGIFKKLTG